MSEPFVAPTETPPETPLFQLNDKVSCVQTIGKTTYGPYEFVINKILPADKGGVIRVSGVAQDGKIHTAPQKICKKVAGATFPAPPPVADSTGKIPAEELERVALAVPPGMSAPSGTATETPVAQPAVVPPAEESRQRLLEMGKQLEEMDKPTTVPAPLPTPTSGPITSSEIPGLVVATSPLSDQSPDSWTWTPVPNIDRNSFQDLLDKVKAGELGITINLPNKSRRFYATPDGKIVSIEYINPPNFIGVVAKDLPALKPFFSRGGKTYRKKNKKTRKAKKY